MMAEKVTITNSPGVQFRRRTGGAHDELNISIGPGMDGEIWSGQKKKVEKTAWTSLKGKRFAWQFLQRGEFCGCRIAELFVQLSPAIPVGRETSGCVPHSTLPLLGSLFFLWLFFVPPDNRTFVFIEQGAAADFSRKSVLYYSFYFYTHTQVTAGINLIVH